MYRNRFFYFFLLVKELKVRKEHEHYQILSKWKWVINLIFHDWGEHKLECTFLPKGMGIRLLLGWRECRGSRVNSFKVFFCLVYLKIEGLTSTQPVGMSGHVWGKLAKNIPCPRKDFMSSVTKKEEPGERHYSPTTYNMLVELCSLRPLCSSVY